MPDAGWHDAAESLQDPNWPLASAVVEKKVNRPIEHEGQLFTVGVTLLVVPGGRVAKNRENLPGGELWSPSLFQISLASSSMRSAQGR